MDVVIEQYRVGFVGAFDRKCQTGSTIFYRNLGWGDAEGAVLLEAVEYAAEHCTFPDGYMVLNVFKGNSMDALKSRKGALNEKFRGKFRIDG